MTDDPKLHEVVVRANRYREGGKKQEDLIALAEALAGLDEAQFKKAVPVLGKPAKRPSDAA